MTPPRFRVRPATPDDGRAVTALWHAALRELPAQADPAVRAPSPERVDALLERAGVHVLVAADERDPDTLVGGAVVVESPLAALFAEDGPTVEALYVAPGARGRGVGTLLLARAARVAQEAGAGEVAVVAPTGMRAANRYYARLGFGGPITRRVTSTSALLRRVASDRGRAAGVVAARRRSLRSRLEQPARATERLAG